MTALTARHAGGFLARSRQRLFRSAPADRDPVVLRHSRIYILPTRRGLALIATLCVMLLTSLNYALSLGLFVTFALSGLVAAALLHAFRNLAGIKVRPLAAGDTFAGAPIAFSLELFSGAAARSQVGAVRARHARRLRRRRRCRADANADGADDDARRIPLGRLIVSSDHPLGLWRALGVRPFPARGNRVSGARAAAPPLPRGREGPDSAAPARGGDADLAGLRDYQHGDPPQRVAWKAVARGAGWFTKSFDGTQGGGPVVLDWNALGRARRRGAARAAHRLGARRRARRAAVHARAAGVRVASGPGTRAPARGADGAGALRGHGRTRMTVRACHAESIR